MNKNLLKSKMVLHEDTGETLAKALGISGVSFSSKLNENGSQFLQGEIRKIKERYNLTPEEVDAIFFADMVS